MAMGTHGRAQHHRVTLEGTAEGRIQRARIEILADTGAYPHNGSQIPMFSRLTATGLYDIGRVEVETTAVVTNQAPTGSYRGAGRPEAALAIERAVDAFAHEAGLDPVDVRFLNFIQPEAMPYTTATGALYDSGDYPAALRMAIDMLGLSELKAEQAQRRARGEDPMGIGIGAFIERAGGALEAGEYAKVEIDPIGRRVIVRTGSTDQGQGHETVWRRLVGDIFETGEVTILAGDTAEVAEGVGTFASRSAQVGASAAVRTAERVLELAKQRAADHLEAAVADLAYEGGTFSVVGSPGAEVSIFDLADGEPLADEEMYVPHAQTFPYGVHAAVVDVSRETGEVKVRRIVAVDDCGKVLNEMLVEGQLLGSLAQGFGQALLEGVRYDSDGQLLSSSLMDYKVPTAADMPPVIHDRLEHPAPSNPLGVKGAGEAGCIGLPPAILNATLDALAPLGVTDLQFPLRPVDVWTAIQEATARG
jgi:carbon-monoxide dehydrogenase large subunit